MRFGGWLRGGGSRDRLRLLAPGRHENCLDAPDLLNISRTFRRLCSFFPIIDLTAVPARRSRDAWWAEPPDGPEPGHLMNEARSEDTEARRALGRRADGTESSE